MPNPRERPAADRQQKIAERNALLPWTELETLTHLDPAGRGVASFRHGGAPLDSGQLAAAALHLALHADSVGIVTGFPVLFGGRPVAETDGPPGALYLARALLAAGCRVQLLAERWALPLLLLGRELWRLDDCEIFELPLGANDSDGASHPWIEMLLDSPRPWTHLIAIERAGPSHTVESFSAQSRVGAPPIEAFERCVAADQRNRCHNMRGQPISALVSPAHRLFDTIASQRRPITTIGIGDGGNEIGMGKFPWELLREAIGSEVAGQIACRVATDYALVAGVSNWGGYALALATTYLADGVTSGAAWTSASQRALIEQLVARAGAVDGLTGRGEATVDGLPLDDYLRPLDEMRRLLGFAEPPAS